MSSIFRFSIIKFDYFTANTINKRWTRETYDLSISKILTTALQALHTFTKSYINPENLFLTCMHTLLNSYSHFWMPLGLWFYVNSSGKMVNQFREKCCKEMLQQAAFKRVLPHNRWLYPPSTSNLLLLQDRSEPEAKKKKKPLLPLLLQH